MSSLPLKDYGAIGNQTSAALISKLGSIDWCCLPYIDSSSHFAALLDENRGGSFRICPLGDFHSEQRYLQRTNVLETKFETPSGRGVLTDWMPISANGERDPVILRRVHTLDGQIEWTLRCTPRFDYGLDGAQAERFHDGVLFRGNLTGDIATMMSGVPLSISNDGRTVTAKFQLLSGEETVFSWSWGRKRGLKESLTPKSTIEFWQNWAHGCEEQLSGCVFSGPWHDLVTRSSLVVKLLTNEFSGSITESATTSIPTMTGGNRNWDHRYAWVREGALAIQALTNLGYSHESDAYFRWLTDRLIRDGVEGFQAVYTSDGGKQLPERELAFLSGYDGCRPVRIGNDSARHFQLDIFGQIVFAAAHYYELNKRLPASIWPKLVDVTDYVCHAWRRPDRGPWGVRSKPEHFVASKMLCWAAIDRAISLAAALKEVVPSRWIKERAILHKTICDQGFDSKRRSFVRAFGDTELDTAALLIPIIGFLPVDDPRMQATLATLHETLSDGVLLRRDSTGSRGNDLDGAHLASSFWYVTCLSLAGRVDEAAERLSELCTYATPLGLFGEHLDLSNGDPSGNFPSASAHLAMINASLYVGAARFPKANTLKIIGLKR